MNPWAQLSLLLCPGVVVLFLLAFLIFAWLIRGAKEALQYDEYTRPSQLPSATAENW